MQRAIILAATIGIVMGAPESRAQNAPRQEAQSNPSATTDNTTPNPQSDNTRRQTHRAGWGQFGGFHSFTSPPSR
jgi:hypothetical protein